MLAYGGWALTMDPQKNHEGERRDAHCVYKNVAQVLAEEPQLEAVAFEAKQRKLSMATLGKDGGARIAGRVTEAVADRESQCGLVDERGICAQCGESPTDKVGDANVVVKNVLGNTVIEKLTCRTAVGFWQWRQLRWPQLGCCGSEAGADVDPDEWKWLATLSGICLVAGLAGFLSAGFGLPALVSTICYAVAYLAGAWEAAEESWHRLRRGQLDIHFLMLSVAIGAAAIGAWTEGALLLFLFSASGAMEHYASGRTRREIDALLRGAPKTATVIATDGTEAECAVDTLTAGMKVRVRAGQQIPSDLRITSGDSACDESNLTGESRPMPKEAGDLALAGTLNMWGVLDGDVIRPPRESALQKIIDLIERAQHLRAPSQRFTDRFGTGYTYAVLSLSGLFFFAGWGLFGWPAFLSSGGTPSAFYRAMTLLVVASPCALVLSVPSAILSAIAAGARRGVLFRGGAAIETLSEVDTVALDKTGTLTRGEPALAAIQPFQGDDRAVLQIAYNLARLSHHPLSRAIQKVGSRENVEALEFTNVNTTAGKGIEGRLRGQHCVLGSRDLIASVIPSAAVRDAEVPDPDTAEVWVGGPGVCGRLLFRDDLRLEARALVAELRRLGLRTVMLTGDRRKTAELIGQQAEVDEVRAELLPEAKVAAIQSLKDSSRKVAMIGDGVNDAPSLAAADVGIAMGARGSDAALEQAEVILMNDRLENFLTAYNLSCRARSIIRQNITIALGTVLVMVLLALARGIPLAFGVLAHEGSTVIVVLNSLRLLLHRAPPAPTAA